MDKFAIIVAGGSGSRMGTHTPKQFLPLQGQPVLMHTIRAFYHYHPKIHITVVLPAPQKAHWKSLVEKHRFPIPHQTVNGGETRFHSVKNGLKNIHSRGLVAIHDGVRPLVTKKIIASTFEMAEKSGCGVAATPLKESIRIIEQQSSKALNRSMYRLVQTPQTFRIEKLKSAYEIPFTADINDDASVAERAGLNIQLTEGSFENIKITTPEDLLLAEAILQSRNNHGINE